MSRFGERPLLHVRPRVEPGQHGPESGERRPQRSAKQKHDRHGGGNAVRPGQPALRHCLSGHDSEQDPARAKPVEQDTRQRDSDEPDYTRHGQQRTNDGQSDPADLMQIDQGQRQH